MQQVHAPNPSTTATPRRIYNPIQKDAAIFHQTSEETNGEYSLLDIEVAPGGGNVLHYHKAFAEHFTVLSGEFGVQVGKDKYVLQPGMSAVAPAMKVHRWYNNTQQTAIVRIELRPGSTGFEQFLHVVYGLARDGLADEQGIPKSLAHKALVVELGDTNLPGFFTVIAPVLRLIARRARKQGIERDLIERYCR